MNARVAPFSEPRFEDPQAPDTAFDRLLAQFRGLADSKRQQGNYLEELARHYLRGEPQWADQLDEVWLWKDWPDRAGRPDTGIDLVASMREGGLMAIQVKFFASEHRVQKGDIDSFLEALGREPFTEGLVIDTARAWSTNAIEALKNRSKPVRRVTLDQLRHTVIDWSTYALLEPQREPARFERKQLRAHQHKAVASVLEAFEDPGSRRGKLIMACGTGKTFTALKLAERWTRERAGGNGLVLFTVPSLALLQQTFDEWSREHDPELPFRAFVVGSDDKIGRVATGDITSVQLTDLAAPATTDGATLARLLDEDLDEGLTVVFSTYQSIEAVAEAQRLGTPAFDLIICDEAHRTTGVTLADEDESHFVKVHDDDIVLGERRVYMTATPRIYSPDIKNTAREQDAELVSMDDESVYGPDLYRIGFGEAVEQGLLTDYKVLVLGVSEDQIASGFQDQLADEGHELQLSDVAKLIGCWNGLAKRQSGAAQNDFGTDLAPMRRAVAFAKDIKTSKSVSHDFPALVDGHLTDLLNDDASDDLTVECEHVDGTMNATERGTLLDWLKADTDGDRPIARILTNARCLSEGVDVPSLDAVLFLNPRKSQVDVVQAVGRVMRRAEGKQNGYIILPIAIPADVAPERALADNERYKVVWQVLQALRSHDERLDAQIGQMGLTGKAPETVVVSMVDLRRDQREQSAFAGSARDQDDLGVSSPAQTTDGASVSVPLAGFGLMAEQWKDAVHAKLVRVVGDRLYWDDWANDIGEIAQRFIALIGAHLDAPGTDASAFDTFVESLQSSVNPDIDRAQAVELVAQHLITMPIFEAMFPDGAFGRDNPMSIALAAVVESFSDNAAFEREREPLDDFYARVTERIRGLDDVTAKQRLLVTLYDRFFKQAFPKLADRMGIVFTPVEVVDYILRSADGVARTMFGKGLTDEGVRIIDPFVGTGTFIARLFQTALIEPADLERKYLQELFANEVVLLSYYIAAVNVESVYRAASLEAGEKPVTGGFPGISLADTFATVERDRSRGHQLAGAEAMSANTARVETQLAAPIDVIVMNPPYSVGQGSANDDNQNQKYPVIDGRIAETYAKRSTAQNKNGLYDSYYRALRWATDRIGDRGIIAFVSNSGFVDGNTADGVRLTWADEFSDIFVYNLRGSVRGRSGDSARREGGNVFDVMVGVAITVLVKDDSKAVPGGASIHYRDVGEYLTREEKLEQIAEATSLHGGGFDPVEPNAAGDWINQRDERFGGYQAMGDAARSGLDEPAMFETFCRGLATSRDAWCYNFDSTSVQKNMSTLVSNYNAVVDGTNAFDPNDGTKVNWNRALRADRARGIHHSLHETAIRQSMYRPFTREWVYFDRTMNDMVYRLPKLFPTSAHSNIAIGSQRENRRDYSVLMTDQLPDLESISKAQWFARWTWEPVESSGRSWELEGLEGGGEVVDGYRRVDNITDETLDAYQRVYGDASVTKDDIFSYVYALLHHPTYRELYEADLKKMLPRIPRCAGFAEYARIGRELADLHLHYEDVEPYPLQEQVALDAPADPYERYRIQKLAWTARRARTGIKVNAHVTLEGIPEEANLYAIGGRSPLEWIIDRYQVKIDKPSGIVNDPNDWLLEHENPRYVVDLIGSLVTLSLETQRLMAELPAFEVLKA